MQKIKKIVVIGPESTGKSTLCDLLAAHFGAQWVPEYARQYLLGHGMDYHYEDLLVIAKGQVMLEDRMTATLETSLADSPAGMAGFVPLFIDTDLYVMKVWSEFVFGRCDPWIIEQIAARQYDLYILCNTDLPWTRDELREYPDLQTREKLFYMYKDILVNQMTPWVEIAGDSEQRVETAKRSVKKFLDASGQTSG